MKLYTIGQQNLGHTISVDVNFRMLGTSKICRPSECVKLSHVTMGDKKAYAYMSHILILFVVHTMWWRVTVTKSVLIAFHVQ